MNHQPKPVRRRQSSVAMRDDEGPDDQRERARNGRGVKPSSSQRLGSPREPRESQSRHDPESRTRRRPSPRPEPSSHRRRHSRDRSRDRPSHPSSETSRRPAEVDDLIPRYRVGKERHREADDKSRRRSRSRERGGHLDSSTPSKRHRSRSHSLSTSHRKRSRRERSPRPRTRDYSPESSRKRGRRSSKERRKPSPRRQVRSPHSPTRAEDTKSHPKRHSRSRSRSPAKSDTGSRRADRERRPAKSDKPHHRSRSRSPASTSRHSSSRRPRPSSRGDASEAPLSTASDRVTDRDHRSTQQDPPRSPKAHRDRRAPEGSPDRHHSSRSDVDEDMTSRGSYRGGHNPMYPHKSQYSGDPRYSHSPQQGNSYHNSPAQSPYGGGGRGGWNGQQQYSPQQQYPPQYPQGGNYGPPNGPSAYHSNQSAPYSAPTGPMQQYPQGNYRGGYRGGGFRGGPFNGRGGRGGFKNAHWNSGNQGPPPREHHDDADERMTTPNAQCENDESNTDTMDTEANPSRPPKDFQDEDQNQEAQATGDTAAPPPRKPPSGPGKFSFAFKPSKPTPTAPKPEISQKFNAAPSRREPPKDNRDRDPPRSAPTEPASARSRHERHDRHDFRNAPDGPKVAPRMRKVKKIMKRPKPRPALPADLVSSDSVFFRKPGNESVVGSGTYGKVFKGLNVYTKGLVALKRIRMEGERDGFPVTAVREIKLLQSLRHTNIVNLQEVMVEKNDCFMVFEYLSHDLTGLLNHPSFKLDAAQKKHLAKQLFEGLDYLHTRGVLHRDIKAANILVSNEGILKLADFGLARFYAKRHQLDYTNRVITIWYRSPELLLGETQYTAAVDIWSAACVMVEIFTRHAIFAGDGTELSQLNKIYDVLGTPNIQEWPALTDMAWFELLRPTAKRKNVFAEKYQEKTTPAGFKLLAAMFHYDPVKRPSAAEVLQHAYFASEEPLPRQAIELSSIDGDWHEFESKALRKENERKDREARRAAKDSTRDKDKKRANDDQPQRDAKRVHVDGTKSNAAPTAKA